MSNSKKNEPFSSIVNELIEIKVQSKCMQLSTQVDENSKQLDNKINAVNSNIPELLQNEIRRFFSFPKIVGVISFFLVPFITAVWFMGSQNAAILAKIKTNNDVLTTHKTKLKANLDQLNERGQLISNYKLKIDDYELHKKTADNRFKALEEYKIYMDKDYGIYKVKVENKIELINNKIEN